MALWRNQQEYAAQTVCVRHRYLIRHALPWYIAFYLQWQRWGEPPWLIRCAYEDMALNPYAFAALTLPSGCTR